MEKSKRLDFSEAFSYTTSASSTTLASKGPTSDVCLEVRGGEGRRQGERRYGMKKEKDRGDERRGKKRKERR